MARSFGQGKSYTRQAQEIILNVWNYFSREKEERPSLKPVECTLEATGIARSTLYGMRTNGPVSPQTRGPKHKRIIDRVDNFDREAVRRIVSSMYEEKNWPTLSSIHERVKSDLNFDGSESTLRNLLIQMGYKYTNRPTRDFVKERPDVVAKRHDYLTKMRRIRLTGCPVVYLDETFIHQNHTIKKCWTIDGVGGFNVPTGKGGRHILLHAGSADGFIPNSLLCFESKTGSADYHEEMNGDVFVQWFKDQFLPNLQNNSVIVMDNASYHSMQSERVPTMNSRKGEMQTWLSANDIPWGEHMIKAQLYTLIQRNKPRNIRHVIDELANEHGHHVLRLPPYHCELNPIELIWAQIKGDIARNNKTFKMKDVHELLIEAISKVSPANWASAEEHCIKIEKEMFDRELRIDSTLAEEQLSSLRFYINDSADESDGDDDSDTEDFSLRED